MNICAASLHPRVLSGEIGSLAGLSRALARRGHRLLVVAPFEASGLLDRSLVALDDGPHALADGAVRMLRTLPRVVGCSRGADVLHLSLPTPAFSWVADIVQAVTPAPVVVGFEGHLISLRDATRMDWLRRAWRSYLPVWAINNGFFGRLSLYRCPAYVVSSGYQQQELVGLGAPRERIHVIPNVVDARELAGPEPVHARKALGLPLGSRIVGYLGHFNDSKGVDVLAEAFALMARADDRVHLALAWSGQGSPAPVRRHLAGLEPRVTWLGKVHVGSFLRAIDALALPYRSTAGQSAFPTLLFEALLVGCPLVTTDLPLIREIVIEGETALLGRPDRSADFRLALERLLQDEPLRVRMVRAQRRVAQRRLESGMLAERYEQVYRSAVGETAALVRAA